MAKETIIEKLITVFDFRNQGLHKLRGIERRIDSTRRKLNSLGNSFFRIGTIASAPLALIARGGITTDRAMRLLEASTGATAAQLAAF